MSLNSIILAAAQPTTAAGSQGGLFGGGMWLWIVYFVIIVGAMYFILIRPQRKKQKDEDRMKESTQVGDEILSIGGIYGKIIAVKEDSYIVESGPDRSKVRVAKWAIQQNFTVHENAQETAVTEKKGFFSKFKKADAPATEAKAKETDSKK